MTAENWRESAKQDRAERSVSSMCGEEGVPSHVIATARALTFEFVAKRLREAANSQSAPRP